MRGFDGLSSSNYSRTRPLYPAEFYYWLFQQVNASSVVWDCACGTGQASVDLAAYFDQIEASDISESQINAATPHRRVTYQVSPAEMTHYPDQHFDLVCVAHALHWFDLDAFWAELKRVLKPGGLFVCWGYNRLLIGEAEDYAISQHVMPLLAPYWPQQSRLLWNEYRDIEFPIDLIDVPKFELVCHWSVAQVKDFIFSWSGAQEFLSQHGEEALLSSLEPLERAWHTPHQKQDVNLPFFVKAGRFN
ncbi:class I SAM-dependent methyltransferase [Marinomonas aquiplantarum]|uniref:Methyltransferase family protein n=1 Tax=Marinomonas aquiplantarum TaxID=491951 RepID=A0A366D0D0_9GAMM|nr:class I SAM-dependent methyltransferase [Marinomonas aquiplantarum]RBO83522.1 methyltransferase family protein [Marinomonas aquiplantarum]